MLVYATIFFFFFSSSRFQSSCLFEGHLRKGMNRKVFVLHCRIYCASKTQPSERCRYQTNHTRGRMNSHKLWCDEILSLSLHSEIHSLPFLSFFFSCWEWPSPWHCSTTSTERGRSTTLSLRRRHLMSWSPTAWWDETLILKKEKKKTFMLPSHFTASVEHPLPPPASPHPRNCTDSSCVPVLFLLFPLLIHFAKEWHNWNRRNTNVWQARETCWVLLKIYVLFSSFF